MAMDDYKFMIKKIDSFDQITTGSIHYVYQDVHFLLKNGNNHDCLLVAFHGGVHSNKPTFRCYNYNGYDVLSISDRLLNKYAKPNAKTRAIALAWFQNSEKHPNNKDLYESIIGHVIKSYRRVLFHGTSGGGYPSLYYSSIFKKQCMISNSQIYPEAHERYEELVSRLLLNTDRYIKHDNIHEHFDKYGFPEKIILYINLEDKHHHQEHTIPFVKYCSDVKYEGLELIQFSKTERGKLVHAVLFPSSTDEAIIKDILSRE